MCFFKCSVSLLKLGPWLILPPKREKNGNCEFDRVVDCPAFLTFLYLPRQRGPPEAVGYLKAGRAPEASSLRTLDCSTIKVWAGPLKTSPSTSNTEKRLAMLRVLSFANSRYARILWCCFFFFPLNIFWTKSFTCRWVLWEELALGSHLWL